MATQNNSLVIISDLDTNESLAKSGKDYGQQFNTALNAAVKSSNTMTTIAQAIIKETAGNPQNFAHLANAFASKISRVNWNSAATFFRTSAKKEGYTVSMTCDRDKDNKKANLIKASFEKTLEQSDEQKELAKKEQANQEKKATKQVKQDIISEYEASHDDSDKVAYPTTQAAIVELFSRLLADSSKASQQKIFALVGASLEEMAKEAPVNVIADPVEAEIAALLQEAA